MNPDLKRLCLAAIKAHDEWYGDRFSITPAGAEEVVRAVLMALREPSRAVKDAGSFVEVDGDYPQSLTIGPDKATEVLADMIDAILAEPAIS